ncbi:unnamed protein product [Pedinophyceae sp. YPF-701]|nr:unnamed protein product [Pedinophyceae sp. YPF-701]
MCLFPPGAPPSSIAIMIPAYRESPEEVHLSLDSYTEERMSPDTRARLELFVILDGHDEAAPEEDNETLMTIRSLLIARATAEVEVVDTPYFRVYRTRYCGIPAALYIKRALLKRGKRFSQLFFYEMTQLRRELAGFEPFAVFMSDSDTQLAPGAIERLANHLLREPKVAAVTGQMLPANVRGTWGSAALPWPLARGVSSRAVVSQYYEYAYSALVDKPFAAACGAVLVLPGAFSLLRYDKVHDCWPCYSARTRVGDLISLNCLELGEDRFLTTLLLMAGHETSHEDGAIAFTRVPETWPDLLVQRRRWFNSAISNDVLLVFNWRVLCRLDKFKWLIHLYMLFNFVNGVFLQPAMLLALVSTADLPQSFEIRGHEFKYRSHWTFWLDVPYGLWCYLLLCLTLVAFAVAMVLHKTIQRTWSVNFVLAPGLVFANTVVFFLNIWWLVNDSSPSVLIFATVAMALLVAVLVARRGPETLPMLLAAFMVLVAHHPLLTLLVPVYGFSALNNGSWGTRETAADQLRHEAELAAEQAEADAARSIGRAVIRPLAHGSVASPVRPMFLAGTPTVGTPLPQMPERQGEVESDAEDPPADWAVNDATSRLLFCLNELPAEVALAEVAADFVQDTGEGARVSPSGVRLPIAPSVPFATIDKICNPLYKVSVQTRRSLVFALWLSAIMFAGLAWFLLVLYGPVPNVLKSIIALAWAGARGGGRENFSCWRWRHVELDLAGLDRHAAERWGMTVDAAPTTDRAPEARGAGPGQPRP